MPRITEDTETLHESELWLYPNRLTDADGKVGDGLGVNFCDYLAVRHRKGNRKAGFETERKCNLN
jgi:hypothetical protein